MTGKQRDVLSVMQPGKWEAVATLADRLGVPYQGTLRRLWLLEDGNYVERSVDHRYRLLPKAEGLRRRFVRPAPRPVPRPKPEPKRQRKTKIKARSFTEKYADQDAERYGKLFMVVRVMRCWLCKMGYDGPGHRMDGSQDLQRGVQGGHTAHHLHRLDREGMIPGDGAAHDLYAGLGGSATQQYFKWWLRERNLTLEQLGLEYVELARTVVAGTRTIADVDLAW